jgi:hypothetical protein
MSGSPWDADESREFIPQQPKRFPWRMQFPAPRPLQTAGREVMAPYDFGVFVASGFTSVICRAARPREPIYRNKNSCRSSRILLDFRFHFSEAYRIPDEAGIPDSIANTAKL